MSAVLEQPDTEELRVTMALTPDAKREVSVIGALAIARAYEVDCAEQAQALANDRTDWAKRIDRIKAMQTESLAPAKKMMEDMKTWAAKWFGPSLADLEAARELGGQKLLAWDQAERVRVAKEQAEREALARKLRQEAEARAAAERARAEEQRKEALRKAEEAAAAQRKAEAEGNARAAATAAAARAKAEEQARAAVESGEAKAQQATLQAAAQISTAAPAEPVKIAGQAVKDNWVRELAPGYTEDSAKLQIVLGIAGVYMNDDGKIVFDPSRMRDELLGLVEIKTSGIDKMAKALKGAMRVPGYVAVNRPQIAGSRK